jgi:hypothetical protein
LEHLRRKLHRDLGWGGEKNNGKILRFHSVGRAWQLAVLFGFNRLRASFDILAVFEENGLDRGMPVEEAHEFGATVATKSDDAGAHDWLIIHSCE